MAFWRRDGGQKVVVLLDVGEGEVGHGLVSLPHIRRQGGGAINNPDKTIKFARNGLQCLFEIFEFVFGSYEI